MMYFHLYQKKDDKYLSDFNPDKYQGVTEMTGSDS